MYQLKVIVQDQAGATVREFAIGGEEADKNKAIVIAMMVARMSDAAMTIRQLG